MNPLKLYSDLTDPTHLQFLREVPFKSRFSALKQKFCPDWKNCALIFGTASSIVGIAVAFFKGYFFISMGFGAITLTCLFLEYQSYKSKEMEQLESIIIKLKERNEQFKDIKDKMENSTHKMQGDFEKLKKENEKIHLNNQELRSENQHLDRLNILLGEDVQKLEKLNQKLSENIKLLQNEILILQSDTIKFQEQVDQFIHSSLAFAQDLGFFQQSRENKHEKEKEFGEKIHNFSGLLLQQTHELTEKIQLAQFTYKNMFQSFYSQKKGLETEVHSLKQSITKTKELYENLSEKIFSLENIEKILLKKTNALQKIESSLSQTKDQLSLKRISFLEESEKLKKIQNELAENTKQKIQINQELKILEKRFDAIISKISENAPQFENLNQKLQNIESLLKK